MKIKLIIGLFVLSFMLASHGQVLSACLTMEQSQAKYNQDMANKITVVNTSTQQLQCYYQQLATYWQQRDKDNQQKAKDIQQIAKDKQQMDKDAQQIATDKVLTERTIALNNANTGYDEVVAFIEVIVPYVGECSSQLRTELNRIHTNRCGGGDNTNPGGGGNIHGFDNPGFLIRRDH